MRNLLSEVVKQTKASSDVDPKNKGLHKIVRKYLNLKRPVKSGLDDWRPIEVELCSLVAWTGALVVAAVVFRSLYLLYMKPEGT